MVHTYLRILIVITFITKLEAVECSTDIPDHVPCDIPCTEEYEIGTWYSGKKENGCEIYSRVYQPARPCKRDAKGGATKWEWHCEGKPRREPRATPCIASFSPRGDDTTTCWSTCRDYAHHIPHTPGDLCKDIYRRTIPSGEEIYGTYKPTVCETEGGKPTKWLWECPPVQACSHSYGGGTLNDECSDSGARRKIGCRITFKKGDGRRRLPAYADCKRFFFLKLTKKKGGKKSKKTKIQRTFYDPEGRGMPNICIQAHYNPDTSPKWIGHSYFVPCAVPGGAAAYKTYIAPFNHYNYIANDRSPDLVGNQPKYIGIYGMISMIMIMILYCILVIFFCFVCGGIGYIVGYFVPKNVNIKNGQGSDYHSEI